MEKLSIGSSPDFIHHSWFEIDKDGPWHVLASTRFGEEGVEGVVGNSDGVIGWHLTIGLDAMFQAIELPTGIAHLDSGLEITFMCINVEKGL